MKSKPFNTILARYGEGDKVPTLWELPGQGVYLVHPDQPLSRIRICSKAEYEANCHVLVSEGWQLENNHLTTHHS